MPILVSQDTCEQAWRTVATSLAAGNRELSNVIVEIREPLRFQNQWLTRFNPAAVHPRGDQIRDVINTIFPQKTLTNSANRTDFYERYLKAHNRSRNRRWGTYFRRLISFGAKNVNQLERTIQVLQTWKNTPHAALTLHLSSPEIDSIQPIGAPCWHFGEFVCPDATSIELVAVYRNHDYFNKALGNFIGLSRLLNFVAIETKRRPRRIICHSVRAYFDVNKSQMNVLLAR
jgi:thymidylate synthase